MNKCKINVAYGQIVLQIYDKYKYTKTKDIIN